MRWYPWLQPHFEQLMIAYQFGRGYHTLLVQAMSGMGDDALIYAITRFLMCRQPNGNKSCGICRSCQLMKSDTHPDYYKLELEKEKNKISIDTIQAMIEKLYERACLDGPKVVWFKDATLLTESAANALLKILEEPPEKTWFFLSCHDSKFLLTTFRSRCHLHYLCVPKETWAIEWLKKEVTVSKNVALAALRLCNGSPGAVLELLKGNHWKRRVQLCLVLEKALKSRDWLSLLTVLNDDQAPTRLYWLIALLLDAIKFQYGVTKITNIDMLPLVNNLAEVLSRPILHAIIISLCQCRKQLLTVIGLNRELLLTNQLLIIEHYLKPGTLLPSYHF